MSLDPAVAVVRLAVRRALADLPAGSLVLVASSGGADSLALVAATVHEARGAGWRVVGVTVDHGMQEGSAAVAEETVVRMVRLGVDETVGVRVRVEAAGQGPEAAAREARYAVLEEVAQRFGAATVLLGHSLDDQAETVLLGLARGSGGRSIAGMRPAFDIFRRPLLSVTRAQTEAACRAQGIDWWMDPHNADPRFTRSRLRHRVMPVLEDELGPGVAAALARTGEAVREDLEALDRMADAELAECDPVAGLDVDRLAGLERAVRLRVLRGAALAAGSPAGELFRVHVLALDEQVANRTHLPRTVELPGRVRAVRERGVLRFEA